MFPETRFSVSPSASSGRSHVSLSSDFGEHREGKVDPGGHAAAREDVPVTDDPAIIGNSAELTEKAAPCPVSGGALTLQQSGGPEDQRSGADGRDVLRAERKAADPAHKGLIQGHFCGCHPARHADEVAAFDLRQLLCPANHQSALSL